FRCDAFAQTQRLYYIGTRAPCEHEKAGLIFVVEAYIHREPSIAIRTASIVSRHVPFLHLLRALRMQAQNGVEVRPAIAKSLSRRPPVLGEVEIAGPLAPLLEQARSLNSGDAKRPQSSLCIRDQVPRSALRHQSERIDDSVLTLATILRVADLQFAVTRDGVLHDRQRGKVFRRSSPASGIYEQPLLN